MELLAGARAALSIAGLPGACEPCAHVRAQRDQTEIVAAIQRQFDDVPVLDDRANRRVLGRDERGHGRDLSGLGHATDLEREVHTERFLHVKFHTVLRRPEALQLSFDEVRTWRHCREGEGADFVTLLGPSRIGSDVLRRHRGARNRGAGGVLHVTGDGAECLSEGRR